MSHVFWFALCSFQCFSILDLEHLTTSQLTSRALAIIKEQAAVDSLCFPETMSKMFIINGPRFFSASWRLIKGWLDPRTASKIEVCSSKEQAKKKLLELVDENQLPSDYGGTGPDTKETLRNQILGEVSRSHSFYGCQRQNSTSCWLVHLHLRSKSKWKRVGSSWNPSWAVRRGASLDSIDFRRGVLHCGLQW